MKSIQDVVNDKVATMISDGSIQKTVEEQIEKAITHAVETQFRSYGTITKSIEECLEKGLQINLDELPFETYNQQMLVAVKTRLGNLFAAKASEKFMNELDNMLKPAPKEITINEFVEAIAAFWKTDEPWDADHLDDYATVELEQSESSMKSHKLKMWEQKKSGVYSSRTNQPDLHLYIIEGKIRISHNQSYNPTCFSASDAYVFQLYAAGTILTGLDEFDPDDCELTLKDQLD